MMTALRILIVVALQTAALLYMIVDRTAILSGDVVTLKVKPVDPSDMFRGDYVILTYDISSIDTGTLPGDDTYVQDGWAFVSLQNQNGVWTPSAITAAMPARTPGTVVLRGQITRLAVNSASTPPILYLTYGIESFFVPQGQGKPIEDERQKGDLTADIAVDGAGRGAIKSLRRADGEVLYTESLF